MRLAAEQPRAVASGANPRYVVPYEEKAPEERRKTWRSLASNHNLGLDPHRELSQSWHYIAAPQLDDIWGQLTCG